MKNKPKIALVCDWLTGIGGAERVVLELHRMLPEAPIYTSQYDPGKIDWFKDADVRTGWLQKLPKGLKKFLPLLRAWWFSHINLKEYDLIISASGAEAKFVKASPGAKHIAYIHAPTHYYWSRYEDYLKTPGFPKGFNWLARIGLKILVGSRRKWDYRAAQRPDQLIANSTYTQSQIKKYYGRNSTVIHPPVDIERFATGSRKQGTGSRSGFVIAGRQTPYKKIDLAVAACTKLGLPLTVIGNGPDHSRLRKLAGPTITFVTDATDEKIAEYFASAQAFIFPGVDDFGIVAVEAMAAGTPVIAYKAGGALDYVIEGQTGMFYDALSVESLCAILQKFQPTQFDLPAIRQHAIQFSPPSFHQKITLIIKNIEEHQIN